MTSATNFTIMYVEDEPFHHEDTIDDLRQDYNLIVAETSDEASAQLRNHAGKIDLILLDIRMVSDTEGIDLARRLRNEGYKGPILGYSVVRGKKTHDEATELGIKILKKDIEYNRLKVEIDRHLST